MRLQPAVLIFFFLLFIFKSHAQQASQAYWAYIERYKDMAIEQMLQYKIPASITLSQGILESGAGKSRLATEANNHFGIKCGGSWTGPYVLMTDDAPNEKFRKYKNAVESYKDHSLFLAKGARYASLFKLDSDDYKGWAHGLKQCGYATNPRYAYLLIDIIEKYNLSQFDKVKSSKRNKNQDTPQISDLTNEHIVYRNNDNYYIIARSGDSFELIAAETGISPRRLRKYNELPKDYKLVAGDVLYLEKKKRKAESSFKNKLHTVRPGESMYHIAQRYGIRLENLYKMNNLPEDYAAQPNDRLKVR